MAEIKVGDRIQCGKRIGTVRAISANGREARWDDGDPSNSDPFTNGFRFSSWSKIGTLKKVDAISEQVTVWRHKVKP